MAISSSKTRKKIEWLLRRAEAALLPEAVTDVEGSHLDWPDAMRRLSDLRDELALAGNESRFDQLGRAIESGATRTGGPTSSGTVSPASRASTRLAAPASTA
jgi:hypothetical protein